MKKLIKNKILLMFLTFFIFPAIIFSKDKKEKKDDNTLSYTVESNTKITFVLPIDSRPALRQLTLKNIGMKNINNFNVIFNNAPDFSSIESIKEYLQLDKLKDAEKAKALFEFFIKYIKYDQEKTPLPLSECDPIKMFNIYGEGQSVTLASAFVSLCEAYRFKGTIWNLKDKYAAPEIYYDKKWHFFDVSKKNYLEDNKGNVLGIREIYDLSTTSTLIQLRDIKSNIRKDVKPTVDFIAKNITTNFIYQIPPAKHICKFSLKRNDEIIFIKESNAPQTNEIKCSYIYYPDISQKSTLDSFIKNFNLANTETDKVKSPILHLKKGAKNGSAEIKIEFPFLIKDATIEIEPKNKKGGNIGISVSLDGNLWSKIVDFGRFSEKGTVSFNLNISNAYSYFIRLEFTQNEDYEAGLNSLKIHNNFQYNPLIYPILKGGENFIDVQFEGKYAIDNKLFIGMELFKN